MTSSDEAAAHTSCSDPTTSTSTTAMEELAQDIERCAAKIMALTEGGLTPKFVVTNNFGSDNELAKGLGTFHENLRTCAVCSDPQHELSTCLSIVADSGAAPATPTAALNDVYYCYDDVVLDPELIPANLDWKQSPEMRRFLHEALGPVLDALLTLRPLDAARYLDLIQTTHNKRTLCPILPKSLPHHSTIAEAAPSLYNQPHCTAPPPDNQLSPAVTEWAFTDLGNEALSSSLFVDSSHNVQSLASQEESLLLSIEDACPILENFHHDPAHSDSATLSSPADTPKILMVAADSTEQPSLFQSSDATSTRIYSDLRDWVQRGIEHQDEHIRAENRVCGAPLQHVLEVVHRDLRSMVDYTTMAAQDLAHFCNSSSVASNIFPLPGPGIPPSNPPQSATAEFIQLSMPPSTLTESEHSLNSVIVPHDENGSTTHLSADRTENPGQRSGCAPIAQSSVSDITRNKCQLSEEEKEITERGKLMKRFQYNWEFWRERSTSRPWFSIVMEYMSIEAAKAHAICCILAEHHHNKLLVPFQECLSLRFKNEYTLSQLLASTSFRDRNAGMHTRYWELLPPPEGAYYEYEDLSYYTSSNKSFPYASSDNFPYPDSEYDSRASEWASPDNLPALEPIPNLPYTTTPVDPESDVIDTTAAETLPIQLPPHKTPLRVRNALIYIYTDTESANSVDDPDSVRNRADRTDHIIHVRRTREWEDGGGSYTDWTIDDEQQAIAI
ncbi:hypothetical protein B0H17DRAFT_1147401 [Mycena rosella]|uniref:Uncharacterized protein n=1 Tax=Mycena rosella TaxID=1033263 RepID=A0AAD7G072_MYCRO|nr:hypothetical protein B0H17DRAFT_1147401 [Mycena rosella]